MVWYVWHAHRKLGKGGREAGRAYLFGVSCSPAAKWVGQWTLSRPQRRVEEEEAEADGGGRSVCVDTRAQKQNKTELPKGPKNQKPKQKSEAKREKAKRESDHTTPHDAYVHGPPTSP
jgi:hypothetical protein